MLDPLTLPGHLVDKVTRAKYGFMERHNRWPKQVFIGRKIYRELNAYAPGELVRFWNMEVYVMDLPIVVCK